MISSKSRQWLNKLMIMIGALLLAPSFVLAETYPDNMLSFIKFPPPKLFTQNLMSVARTVQPGAQTEMLPALMLSAFGYPNYPGVSQTDNISMFFFNDEKSAEIPFVIIGKIAKDSPSRKATQSFQWVIEDRGEWALIARKAEDFAYVKDLDALVAINQQKSEFDVEARLLLGHKRVDKIASELSAIIQEHEDQAVGGHASNMEIFRKVRFIEYGALIAENLEWMELGFNFTDDGLTVGSIVQAIPGTPEGDLFSIPVGGKVTAAQFMSSQELAIFSSKVDVNGVAKYYRVLEGRAMEFSPGAEGKAFIEKLSQQIDSYLAMSDGSYAGTLSGNLEDPDVSSICGGQFKNKEFITISKTFYNKLIPELLGLIPGLKGMGMNYQFEFKTDVKTIDEIPVHELVSTVSVEADIVKAATGGASAQAIPQHTQTTKQYNYYAVVNGNLLNTLSIADMQELISVVKKGKPVANNIATALPPKPQASFQMILNIAEYFGLGFKEMAVDSPKLDKALQAASEQLLNNKLNPAYIEMQLGDNRFTKTIDIPVTTVAKILQAFQSIEQVSAEKTKATDAK